MDKSFDMKRVETPVRRRVRRIGGAMKKRKNMRHKTEFHGRGDTR